MNKDDLKEIKNIIDGSLETHLASVHEEIDDFRNEVDLRFAKVDERFEEVDKQFDKLDAKIDHVNAKLGAFENSEVDKRKQLEVRVTRIEKSISA